MSVGVTLQELSMRTGVSPGVNLKDTDALLSDDEDLNQQQEYLDKRSKMESTFFDRNLKENLGLPILKEFSIKGFAIYIDSGPRARLISVEPAQKKDSDIAFIEVDGQLQETVQHFQQGDKPASLVAKMQEINKLLT
jgi:hypothetical protein